MPILTIAGREFLTSTEWLWVVAIAWIAVYQYLAYLRRTRVGRSWLMVRRGPALASVAGVSTFTYQMSAYVITSAITSGAGALLALYSGNVSYEAFGLTVAISYIVMVVLGGMGSLLGATFGTAVVVSAPLILAVVLSGDGIGLVQGNIAYIQAAIYGLLGLVLLVVLPGGMTTLAARLARRSSDRGVVQSPAPSEKSKSVASGREVEPLMMVRDVRAVYGGGETGVLRGDLDIPRSGAVAILGRNGAGKSSLLYSLAGFPPGSGGRVVGGRVMWKQNGDFRDITRDSTRSRIARGLILVPAERKIFPNLTVSEHLREATSARTEPDAIKPLLELFPSLAERVTSKAGSLSGGERQQLALACALGRIPSLLLVDEASLGLAPVALRRLSEILRQIRDEGLPLVLVEQNAALGFEIGQEVVFMEDGVINVLEDREAGKDLSQVYLGTSNLNPHAGNQAGETDSADHRSGPATASLWSRGQTPMVELKSVSVRAGGIQALTDVSATIGRGEIVGLIGPNGAGKTSLLNALCGYYRASQGDIFLRGKSISSLSSEQIVRQGVGRSFQAVADVEGLTVLEYVALGREVNFPTSVPATLMGLSNARRSEKACLREAFRLIAEAELEEYATKQLVACPYAIRKIADLLRALSSQPKLLLLDEPTSGVAQDARGALLNLIRREVEGKDLTVMIVDHDVAFVSNVCERLIALAGGRVLADGATEAVLSDGKVIMSFLGTATESGEEEAVADERVASPTPERGRTG